MNIARLGLGAFLLLATGLSGWSQLSAAEPSKNTAPPVVQVSKPIVRTVTEMAEFNGLITAAETIELRTLARSHLQRINFRDGQLVKEGELLFELDSRSAKVNLDLANAQIAIAQSALRLAKADHSRVQMLFERNAVPRQEVDAAETRILSAEAESIKAEASRKKAQLDLDFTQVRAPRAGRIGRAQVAVGNLINAGGQETLLATLVSLDPMYVQFQVDELSFQKYRRGPWKTTPERRPILVGLAADQGFPHQGMIDFVDIRANPQTGTVQVRGLLPNRDGHLEDGFRARVRISVGDPHEATLIPIAAIGTDGAKRFVYVINAKNIAQQRTVDLGPTFDGLVAVNRGLTADDTLIIQEIRKIRDGIEVQPVLTEIKEVRTPGAQR
jgi:RND family efflux transporter MFP subunit